MATINSLCTNINFREPVCVWIGWMRLVLDNVYLGFSYQQSLTFDFTANGLTSQSATVFVHTLS